MEINKETQPYRVLARKYRPDSFDKLIGQDVMVRTLTNAISIDRLPHAFILTGTRGVGKTSTARIIARSLNCVGESGNSGPTPLPCNQCSHCNAIAEDRHVDVIEMDAASRTGVNDIRELIDGIRYRPVEARFKIYIIDEVHMLSTSAFNALLKTLEEPPEHVKFIFATTETRKVPVTVLSRCQRFDLRRVNITELVEHFSEIAIHEGIEISTESLGIIARAADGSVRDGLSLLDQAIAHASSGENYVVDEKTLSNMLGLVDSGKNYDLFECIVAGKTQEALEVFSNLHDHGADPLVIMEDLLAITHWLTRLHLSPDAAKLSGISEADRVRGGELAVRLNLSSLGRIWQVLLNGIGEVRSAPSCTQAAEMVLIRLTYMAELPTPSDLLRFLKEKEVLERQSAIEITTALDKNQENVEQVAVSQPNTQSSSFGNTTMSVTNVVTQQDTDSTCQQIEKLTSFDEVVNLFFKKREGLIAAALANQVHLVSFQSGHIAFRPRSDAPSDLATKVSRLLNDWTGDQWLVSLSTEEGAPTLRSVRDAAEQERRDVAISHPLVQAALKVFPNSQVELVKENEITSKIENGKRNNNDDLGGKNI